MQLERERYCSTWKCINQNRRNAKNAEIKDNNQNRYKYNYTKSLNSLQNSVMPLHYFPHIPYSCFLHSLIIAQFTSPIPSCHDSCTFNYTVTLQFPPYSKHHLYFSSSNHVYFPLAQHFPTFFSYIQVKGLSSIIWKGKKNDVF